MPVFSLYNHLQKPIHFNTHVRHRLSQKHQLPVHSEGHLYKVSCTHTHTHIYIYICKSNFGSMGIGRLVTRCLHEDDRCLLDRSMKRICNCNHNEDVSWSTVYNEYVQTTRRKALTKHLLPLRQSLLDYNMKMLLTIE